MRPAPTLISLAVLATTTLLSGCLGERGDAAAIPHEALAVQADDFCVDTTDNTFGWPLTLFGTRYPAGRFDPTRPAIVLVHGAASDRHILAGHWIDEQITGDDNLAHTLAAAGYNVFTYDRPGYGQSPWQWLGIRTGHTLTTAEQVHAAAAVVDAVRGGTYGIVTDECHWTPLASEGSPTVILGGHSYGAVITREYLMDIGNVAGAIDLNFGTTATSRWFFQMVADCYPRNPTADHVPTFCTPEYCHGLWSPDIDAPDLLQRLCRIERMPADPRGYLLDTGARVGAQPARLALVPPIPVLFVAGDADILSTEPDGSGWQDEDAHNWATLCPCTPTRVTLEGSGHMGFLSERRGEVFAAVLDWLDASGFR